MKSLSFYKDDLAVTKSPILMKSKSEVMQDKAVQEITDMCEVMYTAIDEMFPKCDQYVEEVLTAFTNITDFQMNIIRSTDPQLARVIGTGFVSIQRQFQADVNMINQETGAVNASTTEFALGIRMRLNDINILPGYEFPVVKVSLLRVGDIPKMVNIIYLTDVYRIVKTVTQEMQKHTVVRNYTVGGQLVLGKACEYPTAKYFEKVNNALENAKTFITDAWSKILEPVKMAEENNETE